MYVIQFNFLGQWVTVARAGDTVSYDRNKKTCVFSGTYSDADWLISTWKMEHDCRSQTAFRVCLPEGYRPQAA